MRNKSNKDNVTLEALLHLKRDERPSEDFWNTFDKDFERRRLNALVERQDQPHPFWVSTLKAAFLALPALAIMGGSAFWLQNFPASTPQAELAEATNKPALAVNDFAQTATNPEAVAPVNEWPTAQNERLSNQFVVDAITSESQRSMNFRKVLYTPALHLSGATGSSYVRDNLSSRDYRVTTADSKLGRNF